MSSEEFETDLPVAAIVSFAGEESHEFEAYGTDETDLTYKDDVEQGDELVRKVDAEEAITEARQQERQKILDKIDKIEENIHRQIREFQEKHRDVPYTVKDIIEEGFEELRDELEEEVE
jgi:hypothetical protein